MSGRQKVVIVGAGVAGLTAAHELIERDFDVHVYERRLRCGGKAASVSVDLKASIRLDKKVPGEHGFRFFPGWYRHLPDTLGRIPSDRHRDHGRKVLDHLVNVTSNLLASYDRDPIPLVLHAPRTVNQAQKLLAFARDIQRLGLSVDEARFFFAKLLEFLSEPEDVRKQKYDCQSWATFVRADERSPAFRMLASNTQTLVAAKATEASAYTIATMAVRTLFESSLTLDRVLDGPTSDVWIEPWRRYLEGQGVKFHLGYDLDRISFDGKGPNIGSVRFSAVDDKYFEAAVAKKSEFPEYADWLRLRDPEGVLQRGLDKDLVGKLSDAKTYDNFEKNADGVRALWDLYARDRLAERELVEKSVTEGGDVDYYVFAIPVEQMAYFVNRSTMMTHYDESLRNIVKLSASVDWMAGIQFYLRSPLNLEAGHIVCADSEWALTAIDQTQFWREADLPKDVQSILSVDISEWNKKGRKYNKEAFRCTREEIVEEVWAQLTASLNRPAGGRPLQRDMLLGVHLDDNVAERFDRRKQAAYNRAQAVRFSADELLSQDTTLGDAPFIFGDRLEMNVEPILVNRPGSLALRPGARSEGICNMFLAADYVKTSTNLACMEGANEAARRAVNAILDRAGSPRERCQTWDFADNDVLSTLATLVRIVEERPGVRQSIDAATSAANSVRSVTTRAGQDLMQWWRKR
jgi:uncharacterized protein with NAD-binding domain and iron-sulfur cluster